MATKMMRTSIVVFAALVACSLAAPVLDRRVRSTDDLLNTMRSGLSVLSKHSKWRLANNSLKVSCSCLNNDTTEHCQTLQSALNTTCRLYEANKILPNINLTDDTAQRVLEIMSEKGVQDACIWVNKTLREIDSQARLPDDVDCSDVSTLGGVCSQWSEFTAIERIESKVDLLGSITIDEDKWFSRHTDLNREDLYPGC